MAMTVLSDVASWVVVRLDEFLCRETEQAPGQGLAHRFLRISVYLLFSGIILFTECRSTLQTRKLRGGRVLPVFLGCCLTTLGV